MQIRFIDKADFQISGYSVETSLDESSKMWRHRITITSIPRKLR